ncbi:NAD(P)-dependent oxidoreductase [Spirillospora sp. CA-294931]|uniref:NAD(P)-dependent oxidoreductase n=1 Tax=Spirillospora sp. CA-294931 TaxID=3240042 RepID=UPI003D8D9E43
MTPVTIIGLGPMGQALAEAFVRSGHPTTVWNRTASRADALVEQGAALAASPGEAIAASPLVIVCVLDYDVALGVLAPEAGVLKGRTLVNLTADSPARAREAAGWAGENGIEYLDGSIMSPAATIGTDDAVILFSGPEGVYRGHETTLAALGGARHFLGADPGRAAAFDVALVDIYWTAVSGVSHAFALAEAEGIRPLELVPFAQGIAGLLPVSMSIFAEEVERGEFPGDASSVFSAAAGMEHVIHAAEAHGIDSGVMRAAKDVAQRAVDAGYGGDSFSRLVRLQR